MYLSLVCMYMCSVVFNYLWPHSLWPAKLFCPWDFSRQEYQSLLPMSSALAGRFFTTESHGKPCVFRAHCLWPPHPCKKTHKKTELAIWVIISAVYLINYFLKLWWMIILLRSPSKIIKSYRKEVNWIFQDGKMKFHWIKSYLITSLLHFVNQNWISGLFFF